jgi:hypothetical protein
MLDETQKTWVNTQNGLSEYKAIICDYGTGECIDYSVMTLENYGAFATYFDGVNPTDVEISEPF